MTKIFFLVIFPFILLLLPKNIFDNGRFTICILKTLTGRDCYTCGLTRACMHLIHLDFKTAAYFNQLSFVVLPILIVVWCISLRDLFKGIKFFK